MISHLNRRFSSNILYSLLSITLVILSVTPVLPRTGHAANAPIILLDPGHGGHDSGGVSPTGEPEKNITLNTARAAAKHLKTLYTTELTRSDDYPVSLDARVEKAIQTRATLLISLHLAGSLNPDNGQISIIYFKPVAGTASVSDKGNDSRRLAESIRKKLLTLPTIKRVDIFNTQVFLLANVDIPGVLIETDNMPPPESKSFVNVFGQKLSEGIRDYLEK